MTVYEMVLTGLIAGVLVAGFLWPVIRVLRTKNVLDHPNERSSHVTATPKGAGLVIVPVIGGLWFWIAYTDNPENIIDVSLVVAGGILISAVSWLDDLKGLSARYRLATHAVAVSAVLVFAPDMRLFHDSLDAPVFGLFLTGVLWVWFINLFNFMDGIDGISGVNTLTISLGVVLIASVVDTIDPWLSFYSTVLVGSAIGFLIWNWPPAKVFLGDAGSAPLGFFLGWLLLSLAQSGHYIPALLLPGYYLADATITLFKRLYKKEKITQAHRGHYYQLAVRRGLSHGFVSATILAFNVVLIAISLITVIWDEPLIALLIALAGLVGIGLLLHYFQGRTCRTGRTGRTGRTDKQGNT